MPNIPLSNHPDQYKNCEDSWSGKPHDHTGASNGADGHLLSDQKSASDDVLEGINTFLVEIFDADDEVKMSGADDHSQQLFFRSLSADPGVHILTSAAQAKLDSLLQKLVASGRLHQLDIESLIRTQQICERSVLQMKELQFRIRPEWEPDDAVEWSGRLDLLENALRASRIALRIMAGGRQEKQLVSEELVQQIIELLGRTIRDCIVPVVEARPAGSSSSSFSIATTFKKPLAQVLNGADKVLSLFLDVLQREPLAETCVNSLQFLGIGLLFAENAASEKESLFGIQKFEAFRRSAMAVIAEVFASYTEQRIFLVDEILSSLQKLPTARVHARQFRLGDGKRMQLTSALLMKFVQNSTSCHHRIRNTQNQKNSSGKDRQSPLRNGSTSDESSQSSTGSDCDDGRDKASASNGVVSVDGPTLAHKAYESAMASVKHIVFYLVDRASTASKTGETPHRHLLDMFVEDLITVVSLPEWPASDLLLRALVGKMISISEASQKSAPAKNMALETLGTVGCAILDLTAETRQVSHTLEADDSKLSSAMCRHFEDNPGGTMELSELTAKEGPFRCVVEHLATQKLDVQSKSAVNYHLVQWIRGMFWGNNASQLPAPPLDDSHSDPKLAYALRDMLDHGHWSTFEYNYLTRRRDEKLSIYRPFPYVTTNQCRLAYGLILWNMGLCRALPKIFHILTVASQSDQVTVRSRSLKSVNQMLEKDPSILERMPQVHNLINRCATDQSPMVRENALSLLGRYTLQHKSMTPEMIVPILAFTKDSSTAIRKRAMRLLKDIYTAQDGSDAASTVSSRCLVCECLLQRVEDPEEGLAETACQILEDVWLVPNSNMGTPGQGSVSDRVVLRDQLKLFVTLAEGRDDISHLMERFLVFSSSTKAKNKDSNTTVNYQMVATAFELVIDVTELSLSLSLRGILQILTIYARADPRLFSQTQLELLQPYISSLSTTDDLNLFRRVVIILRCVLPILPSVSKDFRRKVQEELLKNVQNLAKAELNEVAACLWTINGVLNNPERLVNMQVSVLNGLHKSESSLLSQPNGQPPSPLVIRETVKIQRLIHLAGHFGHHCDFQPHEAKFASMKWLPDTSVAGKIVAAIKPFAQDSVPLNLRVTAIENMGLVCQAWPQIFNVSENVAMFKRILDDDSQELKDIVLACFRDFFASQSQHFGRSSLSGEKDPLNHGKLGGSMTASDKDGAASLIAQSFLPQVLSIALSSQDNYSLTATELVASIVRQGIVHPKECGPSLIALGTSTNPKIASLAMSQYQALHLQHESMFERDYMRSITQAFNYQRDVVGDCLGYTTPGRSKLQAMFDVIKTSKSKTQTKFLTNVCARIDFEPSSADLDSGDSGHLAMARFLIENLAFLDYGRTEDLTHVVACTERIFAGTGAGVAHAIETEILGAVVDPTTGLPLNQPAQAGSISTNVDPKRLERLTVSAVILTMLWEARNHICRLYGVGSKEVRREGRGRPPKDASKLPPKNELVKGETFAETVGQALLSMESRERALERCRAFVELIAIDKERKLAVEDEASDGDRPNTPPLNGQLEPAVVSFSGGTTSSKRKTPTDFSGTPIKKKRGRPTGSGRRRSSSSKKLEDDDDWI